MYFNPKTNLKIYYVFIYRLVCVFFIVYERNWNASSFNIYSDSKWKALLSDNFMTIFSLFCHMHVHLSQNWDQNNHFDVLNGSQYWLVQKLWYKIRIFSFLFFVILYVQKHSFAFFVPNKIQTRKAPQNDRLNLSFMKDTRTVGKRMARYGRKHGHLSVAIFWELAKSAHSLRLHLRP